MYELEENTDLLPDRRGVRLPGLCASPRDPRADYGRGNAGAAGVALLVQIRNKQGRGRA